jgi:L-rhamnose-H+ transport protein
MNAGAWLSAAFTVLGGALQGGFAAPMKYARKWNHENIWFVFVLTGLFLFPWILTLLTVASLAEVYRAAPLRLLILIAACGIGWGVGAVLVGIAFRMLGIGLGFAIVLGLSALVGSLVPFLMQTPQELSNSQGRLYLVGTLVMLIGIVLVSIAGSMREQDASKVSSLSDSAGKRFTVGLIIAIVAGLLSSLLSDAIAFTAQIVNTARELGTPAVWASNVVLAPTTTGGALANFVYCAFMIRRNRSGKLFWQSTVTSHWGCGIAMGAFWYGGLAIYGLGEQEIGPVDGWPLFMGAMILSSSLVGFLTGEWKSVRQKGKLLLCIGNLTIFLALIVVGMAHSG